MLVDNIRVFFSRFPTWASIVPARHLNLTNSQKIVVVSVTAGVALITMLARYMRRRKRILAPNLSKRTTTNMKKSRGVKSPNEGISPGVRGLHRQGSVLSGLGFNDRMSVFSGSSVHESGTESVAAGTNLTPQQLGVMGMEALETTISYWEDALAAYATKAAGSSSLAVTSVEDAEFSKEIQKILDVAYNLQEESELLFLDQRSVLFRSQSSSKLYSEAGDLDSRASLSCAESFVSAQDEVADLDDFEEFSDVFMDFSNLPLYQSALQQLEEFGIPFRCLRTEMVHCSTDVEYLGKLHCIRLAFRYIFKDQSTWLWFADSGRQVLTDLILYADKDPKEFLIAYEDMLCFLQDKRNWEDFETELYAKEVKALTFYDVVLDYILMDAFEDLESPPSSVTAVVQNRWLSNGFKETALTTAVWSVLKAKRKMLKFPSGFMAHFYAISEQMSPLMAWGFLGPDEKLRDTCLYFKNQVMAFLVDIFSFQKTRFTIVEELSEDIFKHVQFRISNITQKLSEGWQPSGLNFFLRKMIGNHLFRPFIKCFLNKNKVGVKTVFFSTAKEEGPLKGVRILDITRIVAGPYCSMVLGDLGADVIKIEKPGSGDESRKWGPPYVNDSSETCYFVGLNRNKKSVCVNLKSQEGRNVILDLSKQCDVLIENYVPGTLDKLGLGYKDIQKVSPHLIYCSVTGYGSKGPYKHLPGYDVIAASVGGLMSITGQPNGPPCKVGVAMTDLATGLYAHGAILAALLSRSRTGLGQKIDCNLLSTQVACLINIGSNFLNAGEEGKKWGNSHVSIVPYRAYETLDGEFLTVGAGSDLQFKDLCQKLGVPEVAENVMYKQNEDRVRNRIKLDGIFKKEFVKKTLKEWLTILDDSSFPFGPVNKISQVFNDQHIREIGLIKEVEHPVTGKIRMVGPPVEFSRSKNCVHLCPPMLGEHTVEVLKNILGYSDEKIESLQSDRII